MAPIIFVTFDPDICTLAADGGKAQSVIGVIGVTGAFNHSISLIVKAIQARDCVIGEKATIWENRFFEGHHCRDLAHLDGLPASIPHLACRRGH